MRAARGRALLVAALAMSSSALGAFEATTPTLEPSGALRLALRGGFVPGSVRFTDTRTFTEFAEQGRIESRYREEAGPGLEIGLAWAFARRWGVAAAVSFARRSQTGSFSAALPHPLFFGASRRAEGDFRGGSERETAVHLDLTVRAGRGRVEWTLFAGPSLLAVEADLIRAVDYTHAYPYDVVSVTGTPFASARGNAVGFNVGGAMDWRLARHFALGAQARLSRARVPLEAASDDRVHVDGGGVQVAAGLRFDF